MNEEENPAPNPLLDLDDDKPLLCPYQQAGMQDGEICEACQ